MDVPGFATPANTMGMGDPVAPTDTSVGSGDAIAVSKERPKKKKKMTSLKKYLKRKRVG